MTKRARAMRISRQQRGLALIALLAVIALGASWFLVSQLNVESNRLTATNRDRNAVVLNRAKEALIGYIAAQAAKSGENRPGAFPCPEAPADFNDSANEGTVSYPCTLPVVGRFPWRTLGLDKLVDAHGEPLWYAIASGWAGANTVINSNCATYNAAGLACQSGRLSVDGVPAASSDVIALIIAPGPALTVSASANCTAWTQTRPTTAPPDWRNYLECQNATNPADNTFATTGPSGSFNDQIVTITTAEIMPAIEAAIASRIEREIVPLIKTAYAGSNWGTSAANPLYPFAAPFSNPSTSDYRGAAGTYAGLLPFSHTTSGCNPATDPRCAPTFVSWTTPRVTQTGGTGTVWGAPGCVTSTTYSYCTDWYIGGTVQITYEDRMANVANALRSYAFNSAAYYMEVWAYDWTMGSWSFIGNGTPSGQTRHFNSDGSLSLSFVAPTLPQYSGWGYYYIYVTRDPFTFSDHALLSATDPTTGWFVRNEWYRLAYFVAAQGHTASAAPATPACTTGSSCLSVGNVTPAGAQRSILVLAGRSINGGARPSAALSDYFEHGNAVGSYERQPVTASFGATYADTGAANAYVISAASVPSGATLRFKASNANTGASTLTSPATGTVGLVRSDGGPLAAGAVPANGVIEVLFNGTEFRTAKRPFNDRIVVVDSN
jgi:hypothetical protein